MLFKDVAIGIAAGFWSFHYCVAVAFEPRANEKKCQKTTIAIL